MHFLIDQRPQKCVQKKQEPAGDFFQCLCNFALKLVKMCLGRRQRLLNSIPVMTAEKVQKTVEKMYRSHENNFSVQIELGETLLNCLFLKISLLKSPVLMHLV